MAISKREDLNAIVLRRVDYKESSYLLTLFSRELGKLSAIARGAKRKNSKIGNLAELLAEVNLNLTGGSMGTIRDGKVIHLHEGLRTSLEKMYLAHIMVECCDKTTWEGATEERLYDLLAKSLNTLEKTAVPLRITNAFLLKWVSMLGFLPELFHCCHCGRRADEGIFLLEEGGFVCEDCPATRPARKLSRVQLAYLRRLLTATLEELETEQESYEEEEILDFLLAYLGCATGISPLRSYGQWKAIKAWKR